MSVSRFQNRCEEVSRLVPCRDPFDQHVSASLGYGVVPSWRAGFRRLVAGFEESLFRQRTEDGVEGSGLHGEFAGGVFEEPGELVAVDGAFRSCDGGEDR